MYPWRENNLGKSSHFLSPYLHTWELKLTSEVERNITLLGHQISYVIYYQLQGHLTTTFNVLFGFSISEQTDVAFFWCMNTSIHSHERQIGQNFEYRFLISTIQIRSSRRGSVAHITKSGFIYYVCVRKRINRVL